VTALIASVEASARIESQEMNDAAKREHDSQTTDSSGSETAGRSTARAIIARALHGLSAPLVEQIAKHQAGIRWWGGLGSLAAGVGLMAGGLGPLGFSLILVGVAVLVAELERSGQAPSDRKRK